MDYNKQESIENGKKVMDTVSDLFNSGDYEAQKAFIKQFQVKHRTLQQNMLRAFFTIMLDCSKTVETRGYDARNEDGVKTCKIMLDGYEKEKGFKVYPSHI